MSGFNFRTFLAAAAIIAFLTFVTLWAEAARDEGMSGDGIIGSFLADLYYVFRFPTHTFFFNYMDGPMFLVGLFINCIFYGLLVERAFYLVRQWRNKPDK
jgi:hypothetical protein